MSLLQQRHMKKKRRKFEITGYKAQTIPLGMSLDAVIWQPYLCKPCYIRT